MKIKKTFLLLPITYLLIGCNSNLNNSQNNIFSNDININSASKSSDKLNKNLKKISLQEYNKFFSVLNKGMKFKYYFLNGSIGTGTAYTELIFEIEILDIKDDNISFSFTIRNPDTGDTKPDITEDPIGPIGPPPIIKGISPSKEVISVNKNLFWSKLTDIFASKFNFGINLKPTSDISIDCGNDINCNNMEDISTGLGVFKARSISSKQSVVSSTNSITETTFDIKVSQEIGFVRMKVTFNNKDNIAVGVSFIQIIK